MANSKYWLMVIAIPIIFAVGIALFFVLLPPESISIANFVPYASSWSTVVMVLVYVFTTSRQLGVMQKQLNEMHYSRDVQVQPLIYPKEPNATIEMPQYYTGPASGFKKMELMCRLQVDFEVENLGSGPAVEIDFIPKLISKSWYVTLGKPNETTTLVDGLGRRIECISLREGDSKTVSFLFSDTELKFVNSLVGHLRNYLSCEVVFKNALGMTFKETFNFNLSLADFGRDSEILKTCLKTAKTAEIDFGEKTREFESLKQKGRDNDAEKILTQVRKELTARFESCKEGVKLDSDMASGSFSISTISSNEYQESINRMNKQFERVVFGDKTTSQTGALDQKTT